MPFLESSVAIGGVLEEPLGAVGDSWGNGSVKLSGISGTRTPWNALGALWGAWGLPRGAFGGPWGCLARALGPPWAAFVDLGRCLGVSQGRDVQRSAPECGFDRFRRRSAEVLGSKMLENAIPVIKIKSPWGVP